MISIAAYFFWIRSVHEVFVSGFWPTEQLGYYKFSCRTGNYSFFFFFSVSSTVTWIKMRLLIFITISYQIRSSCKLKKIMQTILSLGNALNQGTARGKLLEFFDKCIGWMSYCSLNSNLLSSASLDSNWSHRTYQSVNF